jgi:hypothetical protein
MCKSFTFQFILLVAVVSCYHGLSRSEIVGIQIGIGPSDRMCLQVVKKCFEAVVDAVVMEARQLVTVAVMGVQAAASMGGGVGGG